ncbi:MAG: Holliday junction resolvase RecU [Bacilli bacterium]|jgi:recombination protein U|nr:Holliday junction resolvase RecU [Erysipelotrichia bacterium]
MIKYPSGKTYQKKSEKTKIRSSSLANRGMALEDDINKSNEYYRDKNIALITKRPTPINVVKVDYSRGAKIIDAYFEKQSTTDYNGVFQGKYLDFEAKSTISKTSLPLANITKHQIEHIKKVQEHGGIAFFIIRFSSLNETYLIDASFVINQFKEQKRKSLAYLQLKKVAYLIEEGFQPRLDYLSVVKKVYF